MKNLLTILCLVFFGSFSYSHEVLTDKCYTDPNGICYEPDSKKPFTGIYTHYYENGQLESKENFVNGKQHGHPKWFYKNGKPRSLENFDNRKILGPQKWIRRPKKWIKTLKETEKDEYF